jgi:hypothetical protein
VNKYPADAKCVVFAAAILVGIVPELVVVVTGC